MALTPGFTLIPGYFVGWQYDFTGTLNPTIFTKNAAVIYPYDRAENCAVEALGSITPSFASGLTNTVSL